MTGDPDHALAQLRRWEAVGADVVIFSTGAARYEDTLEMIRLVGEHVIPKLRTDDVHRTTRMAGGGGAGAGPVGGSGVGGRGVGRGRYALPEPTEEGGPTMAIDEKVLQRVVDELEIRNLLARIHNTRDAVRRGEATETEYNANWTEDGVWESPTMGRWEGHSGHEKRHATSTTWCWRAAPTFPTSTRRVSGATT